MKHQLEQLGEELKGLLKQLKVQEKIVADLMKAGRDGDGRQMLARLGSLQTEILERVGLGELGNAAAQATRQRADELRGELRRTLLKELESACAAAGRAFRRLGDTPPELLLAPFSVILDMSNIQAAVCYARQELIEVPATATAIMEAVEREEKRLRRRQPDPEQFFALLLAAYRGLLGRCCEQPGSRVDLAEILPEVALLLQSSRFRSDPEAERFSSFTRAHFLFALARLRQARVLEQDGYRLDLGTATGDSVRRKARVFFIQDESGQGQYYLSLRFVRRDGVR